MGFLFQRLNKEMRQARRRAEAKQRPAYVRWPLLILLFLAIFWAYWHNFQHKLAEIEAKSSFSDDLGQWSKQERQALALYAKNFQQAWGLKLRVHQGQAPLILPNLEANNLYIALDPEQGQALLFLPALASTAIKAASQSAGHDLRLQLEEELGLCLTKEQSSAPCIFQTLEGLAQIFNP